MAKYKPPKLIKPPGRISVAYRNTLSSLAQQLLSLRVPWLPEHTNRDLTQPTVKIVCISDTHNTTPALPAGDLLLHAGDLTEKGSFAELQAQLDWLNTQPHIHKVVIGGNHDLLLDAAFVNSHQFRIEEKESQMASDLKWGDVKYLCDEQISLSFADELSGTRRELSIYGSPTTPWFGTWAFQVPPIRDVWSGRLGTNTSPSKVVAGSKAQRRPDILLTHGPPKPHLDQDGKGCGFLAREVARARPKLVVFGHIHPGYGEETVVFDRVRKLGSEIMDGRRGVFMLMLLAYLVLQEKILGMLSPSRLVSRRRSEQPTRFVNAAVVGGPENRERREPIVVDL
ncbi:MAG: hypothetical protein M1828_001500 [Chrysothrix sp. TS-e1954]|nr:MAG: hypothetical protein M1828_001500 [Chrysothrix sp. TS-e1954]